MSKLYESYKRLKKEDDKYYLFKVGIFYLFLADDAIKMNEELGLKCTHLNDNVLKCGFPIDSLNKYLDIFESKGIEVKIVDKDQIIDCEKETNQNKLNKFLKKIQKEDIEKMNGIKALNLIYELREIIDGN